MKRRTPKMRPLGNGTAAEAFAESITDEQYDAARAELTGYRRDELNVRIVETGAIEYGRKTMRELWMRELTARGFGELVKYLGAMEWSQP